MDINTIKANIDSEVSTRSSDKFGIKVGGELYKELAKAGFIKMATFFMIGKCKITTSKLALRRPDYRCPQ
jgi:hypothetical protein